VGGNFTANTTLLEEGINRAICRGFLSTNSASFNQCLGCGRFVPARMWEA
jgi:hypothetical protein